MLDGVCHQVISCQRNQLGRHASTVWSIAIRSSGHLHLARPQDISDEQRGRLSVRQSLLIEDFGDGWNTENVSGRLRLAMGPEVLAPGPSSVAAGSSPPRDPEISLPSIPM